MERNNWIRISNLTTNLLPFYTSGTFVSREYACFSYDNLERKIIDFEGYEESNFYPQTIYSNSIWYIDFATSALNLQRVNSWFNTTPGNGYQTSAYHANRLDPTPFDRHPTYCFVNGYIYCFSGLNQNIHTDLVFSASDVNISTNTITVSSTSPWQTGDEFIVLTSGTRPGGLGGSITYNIIRTNDRQFQVASSYANAYAGTAIDLTSAGTNISRADRTNNHPSDIWRYHMRTRRWEQIFPSSTYYESFNADTNACVYDQFNKKIIISNMRGSGISLRTWIFDPLTNSISAIATTNVGNEWGPNIQSANCMAWDGRRNVVWAFGGQDVGGTYGGSQLWQFTYANLSGSPWVKINQTGAVPTRRAYHTVVYIAKKDCLLIYGGTSADDSVITQRDTWIYDIQTSAFSPLLTTDAPPVSKMSYGAYDIFNDVVVVKTNSNQFWALRYGREIEITKTLRL